MARAHTGSSGSGVCESSHCDLELHNEEWDSTMCPFSAGTDTMHQRAGSCPALLTVSQGDRALIKQEFQFVCVQVPSLPKAQHLPEVHTCRRCSPLGRPLTTLSSHTHTTALAPEVTTMVGDGHTAHRQRPQAARFSNVIRICGK
jgi:hypothetical protein